MLRERNFTIGNLFIVLGCLILTDLIIQGKEIIYQKSIVCQWNMFMSKEWKMHRFTCIIDFWVPLNMHVRDYFEIQIYQANAKFFLNRQLTSSTEWLYKYILLPFCRYKEPWFSKSILIKKIWQEVWRAAFRFSVWKLNKAC